MKQATFGTSNTRRVLQVLPANGWYSVFWQDTPPYYMAYPLIAWALYEDSKEDIQGLAGIETDADGLIDWSDEADNFATYIESAEPDGEMRTYLKEQGEKLAEIKAKKEAQNDNDKR